MNEAELQNRINPNWQVDFNNMNRILDTLKNKSVDQALDWAETNENKLVKLYIVKNINLFDRTYMKVSILIYKLIQCIFKKVLNIK